MRYHRWRVALTAAAAEAWALDGPTRSCGLGLASTPPKTRTKLVPAEATHDEVAARLGRAPERPSQPIRDKAFPTRRLLAPRSRSVQSRDAQESSDPGDILRRARRKQSFVLRSRGAAPCFYAAVPMRCTGRSSVSRSLAATSGRPSAFRGSTKLPSRCSGALGTAAGVLRRLRRVLGRARWPRRRLRESFREARRAGRTLRIVFGGAPNLAEHLEPRTRRISRMAAQRAPRLGKCLSVTRWPKDICRIPTRLAQPGPRLTAFALCVLCLLYENDCCLGESLRPAGLVETRSG